MRKGSAPGKELRERWSTGASAGDSVGRGFGGRFASVESAVEEIGGGVIGGQPVFVQKEVVDFVREDKLFDFDVVGAEASDEIDGLREVNVAIVVAMNEEHGRFPSVDGSDGRRVVRELRYCGWYVFAVPVVGGPVVDAVHVGSGSKEIGIAAEAHRG